MDIPRMTTKECPDYCEGNGGCNGMNECGGSIPCTDMHKVIGGIGDDTDCCRCIRIRGYCPRGYNVVVPKPPNLLEALSELEHRQWMAWAQRLLLEEKISQRRKNHWKKSFIPYNQLDEESKRKDRSWAQQAIDIFYQTLPICYGCAQMEDPPHRFEGHYDFCPCCGKPLGTTTGELEQIFYECIKRFNDSKEWYRHYISLPDSNIMVISWEKNKWEYEVGKLEELKPEKKDGEDK